MKMYARNKYLALALLIGASLAFPPHALALREQQEEHPAQLARLEAALTSGSPDALLREVTSFLPQPIGATSTPDASAAGLEELPVLIQEGVVSFLKNGGGAGGLGA